MHCYSQVPLDISTAHITMSSRRARDVAAARQANRQRSRHHRTCPRSYVLLDQRLAFHWSKGAGSVERPHVLTVLLDVPSETILSCRLRPRFAT